MDNQVEDIKKKLDIATVISQYLPLKKKGRNFWTCCPFHGEKTPSFSVSPELQIFKCFGCGKSGDIFTFVQEYEKIDFKDALEMLASQAGITLVKSVEMSQADSIKQKLFRLNSFTAQFYHYVLTRHPLGKIALEYLQNRGLTQETIKTFKIGFSPPKNNSLANFLRQKGFSYADMIQSGTFVASRYGSIPYDRFSSRLIFPLVDQRDRIVGFSGRVLPQFAHDNQGKYINSPETEIYHKSYMLFGLNLAKEAIRRQGSAIVVEGEFDLISPYQAGVKNIVAIKGTAFTQEQLQLLQRYTDTLILGLDSDFAGSNAAKKSIQLADNLGFDLKVIVLDSKYKDPDEAVRDNLSSFQESVGNAVPIWDFLISATVKAHGVETPRAKKMILDELLPLLVKIDNSVIRADYYMKLAAVLGSREEIIAQEAQKHLHSSSSPSPAPIIPSNLPSRTPRPSDRVERLEEYLLSLIFAAQKPAALAQKLKEHLDAIIYPKHQSLLAQLDSNPVFDPAQFARSLPPQLVTVFQNIYLQSTNLEFDSRQRQYQIKKTLADLNTIQLKEKLKQLSQKIAQLEATNQTEELKQFESEYNIVLARLARYQTAKL